MRIFAAILLTFCTSITFAQVDPAYIDSVVNASLESVEQAGIAVAVVQDGEVIHSKGYGLASLETGAKVDENTLFSIASNSKAFTTASLGMLVDQGKLNWNDKVVDIIPEFRMYDPYVTEHFTIVDLVTHRSGLGLGAGDLMFIPDGSNFKVEDVLSSFQYQEPVSEFRTKYDYDNLLYIVAGEVIRRVSGKPWDEFVEQEIMAPLGMKRSAGYLENLKSNKNIAQPHSTENGKLEQINEYKDPNKIFGPAGGIYASVADLTHWMQMQLNSGTYNGDTLLQAETQAKMWQMQTLIWSSAIGQGVYNTHYNAYGLGWDLEDKNGFSIVSHTGGMPGMLSHTVLIPELNVGIVVLTNTAPGGLAFVSVMNEIVDAYIDADDADWMARIDGYLKRSASDADEVVDAVWETCKNAKTDDLKLEDFEGVYRDDWFGEVEIENRDGKLWFVSKRSPRLTGEMFYYQANTFAIKWNYREMNCDAFASFTLDENGTATEIKMKGISPNIDFSFDFHDLDLKRVE
ncbi:MAG: serine hydrolase [bacterium]|nr:serine hydrolase [bacterium]